MHIGLYLPLIISGGILIALFKGQFGQEQVFTIRKSDLEIQFSRNFVGKLILFISFWSFIPAYASMDFSKYYPPIFHMEVFFDDSVIRQSLEIFSEDELKAIGFDRAKPSDPNPYYVHLDTARAAVTGEVDGFFSVHESFYSKGSTTYVNEKLSGFQRYHVIEVEGQLSHEIIGADGEIDKFKSFFTLSPSAEDYFEPSLKDIFLKRYFITFPKFRQSIASYDGSEGERIVTTLRGLTKVSIWPVPGYSNTVYFYENASGELVPIGVAIYK